MKKSFSWRALVPDLVILLLFVAASALYFYPALMGDQIYAADALSSRAALQESKQYTVDTGDYTYWTGSMFSGMPNYQVGGNGGFLLDHILRPLRIVTQWGSDNVFFIFLFYLCAFFLLLRSFKIDKWLCLAGAFAISLSSYFFVIIAAAHNSKCMALTWVTLVVVGFVLIYRKQYGWGALLVMLFTYLGFFLHLQMAYYLCLMMGIFFFAELALAWKNKEWKHFGIATAVFVGALGIGLGMCAARFMANQTYAEQTMRGGHSDLTSSTDAANKTAGLNLDYATTWSYGIDETLTLLIPNYMGGASGYNLGKDSPLEKDLKSLGVPAVQAKRFCQQAPTYWGDKPFTSGPVYAGAVICFLFLLGLLIVSGPYKWALLVATLFSVALAWGRHFMPLTELFFAYFPMYNKFRAVESVLVVAEITMPLLAFLSLKAISDKAVSFKRLNISILIAGGLTALICLGVGLFSSHISTVSDFDAEWKTQVPQAVYNAVLSQRTALMRADAFRSLLFVLLGAGLVYAYAYLRYKKPDFQRLNLYIGLALTVLIVADMWPVNKRFCNNDQFVSRAQIDKTFRPTPSEQAILQDTTCYRTLNLTANVFNDARTSYYLKSIGGYSAAKLRRYQDLIDVHLQPEINPLYQTIARTQGFQMPDEREGADFPVLNMLNMKYVIVPLQKGEMPVLNPYAMGNCWWVDSVVTVSTADEEIEALATLDLHRSAVTTPEFLPLLQSDSSEPTTMAVYDQDQIELTHYAPNRLSYTSQSTLPRVAVFSEIYYPKDWHLYLLADNGELDTELPLARVNYALRAALIPAGKHRLQMVFEPRCVQVGNIISILCFGLFLLTLGLTIFFAVRARKRSAE